MWVSLIWMLSGGAVFAFLSLTFGFQHVDDPQDLFVYLAKAQRAFLAGCILGWILSILASLPLITLLLLLLMAMVARLKKQIH